MVVKYYNWVTGLSSIWLSGIMLNEWSPVVKAVSAYQMFIFEGYSLRVRESCFILTRDPIDEELLNDVRLYVK